MSFGFSIGDFITVAQLAKQLYRDIYHVARGAPKELQSLMSEIATLSQSIDFLIDEAKDPQSILVAAGDARCRTVHELLTHISNTLCDLEKFAKKHQLIIQSAQRSKVKRVWDKVKWATEVSSVDQFLTKISYHNGKLNLLLTLAQKYASTISPDDVAPLT